jgi:hypothetical protein
VLASLGAEAIDAIVMTIHAHPRTDILDEAELALRAFPTDAIGHLRHLVAEQRLVPGARACLLRAVVRSGGGSPEILRAALNDSEPELRDCAASLVGELDLPDGLTMLERRLARETSAMVRDSIREALASLAK